MSEVKDVTIDDVLEKMKKNNCRNILLFVFLNDEKAGQYEA